MPIRNYQFPYREYENPWRFRRGLSRFFDPFNIIIGWYFSVQPFFFSKPFRYKYYSAVSFLIILILFSISLCCLFLLGQVKVVEKAKKHSSGKGEVFMMMNTMGHVSDHRKHVRREIDRKQKKQDTAKPEVKKREDSIIISQKVSV